MSNLFEVAAIVNGEVPGFKLGLYQPDRMKVSKKADCVGRAALAATLLLGSGIPEEAISLLVSDNHAMPRGSSNYWHGHAALLVDLERGGGIVDSDSDHRVYVGKSDHVISLPDDQGQPMCKFRGQTYSIHHPVGEGFAKYQEDHPMLSQEPQVSLEDYARVYSDLIGR